MLQASFGAPDLTTWRLRLSYEVEKSCRIWRKRQESTLAGSTTEGYSALRPKRGWTSSKECTRYVLCSNLSMAMAGLTDGKNFRWTRYRCLHFESYQKWHSQEIENWKYWFLKSSISFTTLSVQLAKAFNIESHVLSPEETKKLYPLMNVDGLYGSVYSPSDGTIDPAGYCSALARGARKRGGQVRELSSCQEWIVLMNSVWQWTLNMRTWKLFSLLLNFDFFDSLTPTDNTKVNFEGKGFCFILDNRYIGKQFFDLTLQIFEKVAVTGIQTKDDDFGTKRIAAVETDKGTVKTNAVANCTGEQNVVS